MALILISHRGNVDGPNKCRENSPKYIEEALKLGYDVEIDVWYIDGFWFLGHDKPQYHVDQTFIENNRFWCHAKNYEAFEKMLRYDNINCFWHEHDAMVLTSKGYVWTYIGKELINNSICVLPEITNQKVPSCSVGICSDYIKNYS